MSHLGVQQSQETAVTPRREATTRFLDLLRDRMDGQDRASRRRRTLKERLGFKGIRCCGPTWGFRSLGTISAREVNEEEAQQPGQSRVVSGLDSGYSSSVPSSGINLAAALAAERDYRAPSREPEGNMTPLRVSLMRLLEETTENGEGRETERLTASLNGSNDSMCCVCMGRKKDAAFIPCGHTFCRVCSRELWLNRGSCPLCNRLILEILDIY